MAYLHLVLGMNFTQILVLNFTTTILIPKMPTLSFMTEQQHEVLLLCSAYNNQMITLAYRTEQCTMTINI